MPVPLTPVDPVKPAEVIAGEKRAARKPGRAKGQVRAH